MDSDCNKRGQTSRPVVGAEIQTSCNFKTNIRDRYYAFSAFLYWDNSFITLRYAITSISLCLETSILSYTNIFFNLRHHQNQQTNQANQLNMERYKKILCAAIWLQLTLVACYLPSAITMVLIRLDQTPLIFSMVLFVICLLSISIDFSERFF